MQSHICKNNDPRSFLYYKGEYYINGTEITLSDKYINNNLFNGKKMWKYARFDRQVKYQGCISYLFSAIKFNWINFYEMNIDINTKKDYAGYFIVRAIDINEAVGSIIKPIKLTREDEDVAKLAISNLIDNPKTDLDYPQLIFVWIIYIIAMVASLIFKQFYIIWIVISYIFFAWRKDILRE